MPQKQANPPDRAPLKLRISRTEFLDGDAHGRYRGDPADLEREIFAAQRQAILDNLDTETGRPWEEAITKIASWQTQRLVTNPLGGVVPPDHPQATKIALETIVVLIW